MRPTLILLGLMAAVCVSLAAASSQEKKSNQTEVAKSSGQAATTSNLKPVISDKLPQITSKEKSMKKTGDEGVLTRRTRDLDAAAGEHGKYMLVKKKPKHKKIKMEVYEPKMKYKKIKMKIPVKKMKKKKVKGYLVKKEKHEYM